MANGANIHTALNQPFSGMLSASDADANALTFSIVANGSKGVVVITNAATGAFTYTPDTGAAGGDSFTFKVNDGQADSNVAIVNITIDSNSSRIYLPLVRR
ncbi:MAG: Ig-like domain-containing protein [Roseiflexaceae bacterium]